MPLCFHGLYIDIGCPALKNIKKVNEMVCTVYAISDWFILGIMR